MAKARKFKAFNKRQIAKIGKQLSFEKRLLVATESLIGRDKKDHIDTRLARIYLFGILHLCQEFGFQVTYEVLPLNNPAYAKIPSENDLIFLEKSDLVGVDWIVNYVLETVGAFTYIASSMDEHSLMMRVQI